MRKRINSLTELPFYKKGIPPEPLYDLDFMDTVKATWGNEDWGYKSVFGRIKKVLMCRPGAEQADPLITQDYQFFSLPQGGLDFAKLQKEHNNLVSALEKEGAEVVFLNREDEPFIGTYGVPLRTAPYTHETIVVPGGAIVERPTVPFKKGLEYFHAKKLIEIGCPILHTIRGKGAFESSNLVWVDDRSVLLATGLRGNMEGARQVEQILREKGIDDIHFTQLPGTLYTREYQGGGSSGMFHLDGTFGMAYYNLGVIWPGGLGYEAILWLRKKGVELIQVPDEELNTWGVNLLPVAPKKVIVSTGSPRMCEQLDKRGITVIEVDLAEFAKGGGGPTCLTIPLIRAAE